jgi:hypothetical protein
VLVDDQAPVGRIAMPQHDVAPALPVESVSDASEGPHHLTSGDARQLAHTATFTSSSPIAGGMGSPRSFKLRYQAALPLHGGAVWGRGAVLGATRCRPLRPLSAHETQARATPLPRRPLLSSMSGVRSPAPRGPGYSDLRDPGGRRRIETQRRPCRTLAPPLAGPRKPRDASTRHFLRLRRPSNLGVGGCERLALSGSGFSGRGVRIPKGSRSPTRRTPR